jgi:hypothetical protein
MRIRTTLTLTLGLFLVTAAVPAQTPDHEAVRAVVDSALATISRSDFVALTDLMLDEAVVVATSVRDGAPSVRVRTRAQERATASTSRLTERGWDPIVQLQAGVAIVWLPYDFYIDDAWSHCGIDTFTLVKQGDCWWIAALAYTVEQPPACARHPAGPPPQE